jgi:hypothetical protein
MTAAAALEKQILLYRRMTGEQRLAIALDLHELSCDVAREGIRHQYPEADANEVERLLRRRIELSLNAESISPVILTPAQSPAKFPNAAPPESDRLPEGYQRK